MEAIISAAITGGLALIGVIITNLITGRSTQNKVTKQIEISQAVTDTKLDNLTEEVKRHNNFAMRVPVLEEQIRTLGSNYKDLNDRLRVVEQDD